VIKAFSSNLARALSIAKAQKKSSGGGGSGGALAGFTQALKNPSPALVGGTASNLIVPKKVNNSLLGSPSPMIELKPPLPAAKVKSSMLSENFESHHFSDESPKKGGAPYQLP
jgi:hypothetical protein